jgi:hypothetical protein
MDILDSEAKRLLLITSTAVQINGDDWEKNDKWWLSDIGECDWYNRVTTECSNDGSLIMLAMRL